MYPQKSSISIPNPKYYQVVRTIRYMDPLKKYTCIYTYIYIYNVSEKETHNTQVWQLSRHEAMLGLAQRCEAQLRWKRSSSRLQMTKTCASEKRAILRLTVVSSSLSGCLSSSPGGCPSWSPGGCPSSSPRGSLLWSPCGCWCSSPWGC